MNRLLICTLAVVSLHSFGAAGPTSLSGGDTPSFLRIMHSKDHPEVSVRCIEESTPDFLFYGEDRLFCVFVGHVNPHVRKQVLDDAEQKVKSSSIKEHVREGAFLRSLDESALKAMSVAELICPTRLYTDAFAISCYRRKPLVPIIDIHGEQSIYVQDSTIRYPKGFNKSIFAQELFRRAKAGECDQSALTDRFRKWIENKKIIGFEIDPEELRAYFEKKNSCVEIAEEH